MSAQQLKIKKSKEINSAFNTQENSIVSTDYSTPTKQKKTAHSMNLSKVNSLRRNRKRKNKAQKDIRRADVFFYCANLYEKRRKHTIIYICKFSQNGR